MTKVTNIARGSTGVWTKEDGLVLLSPGESRDLDLADEKDIVGGRISIEGYTPEKQSPTLEGVNNPPNPDADKDEQIAALTQKNELLQNELTAAASKHDELQRQIDDGNGKRDQLQADHDNLKNELDLLKSQKALEETGTDKTLKDETEENQVMTGLEARHKGGGVYSVFDSNGAELVTKLTSEDKDAFNAMSDEEKTAYVRSAQASSSGE